MSTVSPKMSLGAFAAQNLCAERQGIGTVATPLDLRRCNCPDVASSDVIARMPGVQQAGQFALLSLLSAALETFRHLVANPPAFQLPGRGVF